MRRRQPLHQNRPPPAPEQPAPAPEPAPADLEPAPPPLEEPPEPAPPEPPEDVSLVVWQLEYDALVQEDMDGYITDFTAENPNVDITLEFQNFATVFDDTLQKAAAGALPHVLPWFTPLIGTLSQDLAAWEDWAPQEFLDGFVPGALAAGKYQGRTYGVPYGATTRALYYRRDLFDEAGLAPPTTWDELVATGQVFQEAYPDMAAISIQGHNGDGDINASWVHSFLAGNGGAFTTPDDETNPVNSPELVEAVQFMSDLINEHKITQANPLDTDFFGQMDLFTAGRAGMNINGPWLMAISEDSDIAGKWALAPVPDNGTRSIVVFVDHWAMGGRHDDLETASSFVQFVSEPERHLAWVKNRGFLPALVAVQDDDFFAQEGWALFRDQLNDPAASVVPRVLKYTQWDTILVQAVQRAFQGNDAESELNSAQTEMENAGVFS